MTVMICPLCGQRVTGEDADQLSEVMKEHLATVHRMSNLSQVKVEGIGESIEREGTSLDQAIVSPGEVGPSPYAPAPPGSEALSGYYAPARAPPRAITVIRCPFCGQVIAGDDENDLGRRMKDHWGDRHQIRPTLRAEVHLDRGRP